MTQTTNLQESAKAFYNATMGDPTVIIRCPSAETRDKVFDLGKQLRDVLIATAMQTTPAGNQDGVKVPS